MENNYPCVRNADLVVQELENEILVYDLITDKAHSLNKTAAFIWKNCDGNKSPEQLAEMVENNLKLKCDRYLVDLALHNLSNINLISPKFSINKDGISRRKLITRYGTMAIAIPVVASIIAPTSAQAASTCANQGDPCIQDSDCCPINDPGMNAYCYNDLTDPGNPRNNTCQIGGMGM